MAAVTSSHPAAKPSGCATCGPPAPANCGWAGVPRASAAESSPTTRKYRSCAPTSSGGRQRSGSSSRAPGRTRATTRSAPSRPNTRRSRCFLSSRPSKSIPAGAFCWPVPRSHGQPSAHGTATDGCAGTRTRLPGTFRSVSPSVAECSQQSLVSLVSAGDLAEVRVMVPDGPVIQRVRAVPGLEDRGQAAPATVNHVALRGEREGRPAQPGPCGRAERIKRRITAVGEGPDPGPPDLGWVQQQRVQPKTLDLVPSVPLRLTDQGRTIALRGGQRRGQYTGPRGDDVRIQDPDPGRQGARPGGQPGDPLVQARAVLAVDVIGEQRADPGPRGSGQQLR